MIKIIKGFLSKNKFTLLGVILLSVFGLALFWQTLINGNVVVMEAAENFKSILTLFRFSLYMVIFYLLHKNKKLPKRTQLIKLTIVVIMIYELIFIVELPLLLFKDQ